MIKTMVYPYGKETAVFGRFPELAGREIAFVSPKGWGYGGFDISKCDGGYAGGAIVSEDAAGGIAQADEVVFVDTNRLDGEHYAGLLQKAADARKKVYLTADLAERLAVRPEDFPDGMEILPGPLWGKEEGDQREAREGQERQEQGDGFSITETVGRKLYKIPVPIVSVAGVGEFCDQFELMLEIGAYFKRKGYKVLQLGTKQYGGFFGARTFPRYVWEGEKAKTAQSLRDRILNLNEAVYEMVKKEDIDLVVLEIPGDLMPLNPYIFDDFGEKAILVHNALPADAGILSLYAHPYIAEFLDRMVDICRYRYNMPVDGIHASNTSFDVSQETLRREFMTLKSEYVQSEFMDKLDYGRLPVYQRFRDGDMERMCGGLEEKLLCEF